MSEFWFIRHGESETNAGLPSKSDAVTPLTDKGIQQSACVASAIESPPGLIVLSPYSRTEQTAQPTLRKFPSAPVETWPIHEFSYLSHAQYAGTDSKLRRNLSKNYFWSADPDEVLGPGGESFNQFIDRVEATLLKLLDYRDAHDRVLLFGHGWFIRAALWLLDTGYGEIDAESDLFDQINAKMPVTRVALKLDRWLRRREDHKRMHSFLLFSGGIQTPNCSIIKFRSNQAGQIGLAGFTLNHLPEPLRKTSFRNR